MKKKIKVLIISALTLPFVYVAKISAQNIDYSIPNPTVYNSLEDIINAAASLIQPLFLLTFGAMVLYGAFIWLTSQGEEEKIANAKKTITAAIVGFIIAALAPSIVNTILSNIGVETLN